MVLTFFKNTLILTLFICFSCGSRNKEGSQKTETVLPSQTTSASEDKKIEEEEVKEREGIVLGANRVSEYIDLLKDKNVGVVANQTSIIEKVDNREEDGLNIEVLETFHLVDMLIEENISVKKVFAPEHGFRGTADAGELVKDGVDTKTGIPILSLHGKNKKPSEEQLKDIDIMVFDIQDVGVRFYTYISTLHYVMEACSEAGVKLLILDRPNPNGHYIDGPVMENEHRSFLGMHPIPLVHGMTIGEYAQMINGEKWLKNGVVCDLQIIKVQNYDHQLSYSLLIRPSPNLPNDVAINLYPSLGLLEGTNLNAGRGTEMQFQIFGSPHLPDNVYTYSYTPNPNFGSKYPKHKGVLCNGIDLRITPKMNRIDLTWIIEAYNNHKNKNQFFNTKNFTTHAGTSKLQEQIEQGYTYREIRKTWLQGLADYDKMRQSYLLYE